MGQRNTILDREGVKFSEFEFFLKETLPFAKKNTATSSSTSRIESFQTQKGRKALEEIAQNLSIRLEPMDDSFASVLQQANSNSPVLAEVETRDGFLWIAVLGYKGNQIKIRELGQSSERKVTKAILLQLLQLNGETERQTWYFPSPSGQWRPDTDEQNPVRKAWKRLRELLGWEMRDILSILGYGIGSALLGLVVPIATASLVNTVAFGNRIQPLFVLTFLVLFFLSVSGALRLLQTYVTEYFERRLFVRFVYEYAQKFPKIDSARIPKSEESLPELSNRFLDVAILMKNTSMILVDGSSVLLFTLVGFLVIAFYDPIFLLFSFGILSITIGFLVYALGKGGAESSISASKKKYNTLAWIRKMAEEKNQEVNGTNWKEKTDEILRGWLDRRTDYFRILFRQELGFWIVQAIGGSAILGIGGFLVIQNHLSLGQLIAAELIVAKVLYDFTKIPKYLELFYDTIAAMDKVSVVLDLPEKSDANGTNLSPPKNGKRTVRPKSSGRTVR